jgi:hypothetical protein
MGLLFPSSLPLGLEMKREDSPVSHEKIRTDGEACPRLTVHELLLRSDCYRPNDMATMKDLAMAVRLTVDNRCIQMKRKPLDAEGGCQPVINLWI